MSRHGGRWPLPLTQLARKMLEAEMVRDRLSLMFGDGQEREYVLEGFPTVTGILATDDERLLREWRAGVDDVDADHLDEWDLDDLAEIWEARARRQDVIS